MRQLGLIVFSLLLSLPAVAQRSYFEPPRAFLESDTRYAETVQVTSGALLFHQRIAESADRRVIDISVQRSGDGVSWGSSELITGGIGVEGDIVPPVYSVASDGESSVLLSILDFQSTADGAVPVIRILLSTDEASSFEEVFTITNRVEFVSPRVFASAAGGWFLTLERFGEPRRIVFLTSEDGREWSEPLAIPVDTAGTGSYQEIVHTVRDDRDLFLFVGLGVEGATSQDEAEFALLPQLYAAFTRDRGASWLAVDPTTGEQAGPFPGIPLSGIDIADIGDVSLGVRHLRISASIFPLIDIFDYGELVMRRPAVGQDSGLLVFEAGKFDESDDARQVAATRIDANGNLAPGQTIQILTANGLSSAVASTPYNQPTAVVAAGREYVVAYRSPEFGPGVVLYEFLNGVWVDLTTPAMRVNAAFPAAISIGSRAHFFWHQRTSTNPADPTVIAYMEPDQRALPPVVSGENFTLGERSGLSNAEFTWAPDTDAAGIVGYSFAWTRDATLPVETLEVPSTESSASFTADEDGPWYLRIRAVDRAGNWSPPGTFTFFRDTTPPGRVAFRPPPLDEDGFLASNTFTLSWDEPPDEVIGGYFTDLVFIANENAELDPTELPLVEPPQRDPQPNAAISRENYDNGLWALAVTAVDSVGNIGEPSVLYVRMNKYIPVTEITTIVAPVDPLGRYNLNILGRGFTANGIISQVILDQDGVAPFDYIYDRSSPGYRIFDDRNMSGPLLDDIDTGEYFVGLFHTERGLEFAEQLLTIERNGTVKFGAFTVLPGPEFAPTLAARWRLNSMTAIAWLVLILMLAVAALSSSRLVLVAREAAQLRLQARALVTGRGPLLPGTQQRIREMKREGLGLRTKFALMIVALVVAVVGGIAFFLGSSTLQTQQRVLLQGLSDRVDVLGESMVTRASDLLPERDLNSLDLNQIPASIAAMDEALYATVTGPKTTILSDDLPDSTNYVWGSNDPRLLAVGLEDSAREELIASRGNEGLDRELVPSDSPLNRGRSLLVDSVAEEQELIRLVVDRLASISSDGQSLNALVQRRQFNSARITELNVEIAQLAVTGADTSELRGDLATRQRNRDQLNVQVEIRLEELVLDALALVRRQQFSGTPSAYVPPEDDQELLSDVAEAREFLLGEPRFAVLVNSPVLSLPFFDPNDYNPEVRDHVFYQVAAAPDLSIFPSGSQQIDQLDEADLSGLSYVQGSVRIGIGTDLIVEEIATATREIILLTLLVAGFAVLGGVGGAIALAAIVVIPIRKVIEGVETIRRSKDKSKLGREIDLTSRDELRGLAESINTMSEELAAAAQADNELKATSELQKLFIPLEKTGKRKLTTTEISSLEEAEFFGYYEGADALSGDYFTFQEVKPGQYAFIKCDVAGHGVEAAFIMAIVATMYDNRFSEWTSGRRRIDLVALLHDINKLLGERGFEGKFAAMTMGVIDLASGTTRLAHGGDLEQRIYRSAMQKVEEIRLTEAPAPGALDVEIFGRPNYEEVALNLALGDILLMATDGIEESARYLRSTEYDYEKNEFPEIRMERDEVEKLIPEAKEYGVELDWDSLAHNVKIEFSTARMVQVIEQAMKRSSYTLRRYRPLEPDETLRFDYKGLSPTAENLVLSVMAVEKVFRLTRAPAGADPEPVQVDAKLCAFLEERFSAFRAYFSNELVGEDRPDAEEGVRDEYRYFAGLLEEIQADDLTILAIRKK